MIRMFVAAIVLLFFAPSVFAQYSGYVKTRIEGPPSPEVARPESQLRVVPYVGPPRTGLNGLPIKYTLEHVSMGLDVAWYEQGSSPDEVTQRFNSLRQQLIENRNKLMCEIHNRARAEYQLKSTQDRLANAIRPLERFVRLGITFEKTENGNWVSLSPDKETLAMLEDRSTRYPDRLALVDQPRVQFLASTSLVKTTEKGKAKTYQHRERAAKLIARMIDGDGKEVKIFAWVD